MRLDPRSYPLFFDDNFLGNREYAGPAGILSREFIGVRFEKMLDQDTALVKVLGYKQGGLLSSGSGMESIGQLVVLVPPGSVELNPESLWVVQPLGLFDGANAFGTTVRVPVVRFYKYWEPPQQPQPKLEGQSKAAVDLVQSRIKPTDYLTSLDPDFSASEWKAVNNNFVCEGCWFVTYHLRIRKTPTEYTSYNCDTYECFENPGWEVNLKTQTVVIMPDDGSNSKFFRIVE